MQILKMAIFLVREDSANLKLDSPDCPTTSFGVYFSYIFEGGKNRKKSNLLYIIALQ
jgi:hypothetical protein